ARPRRFSPRACPGRWPSGSRMESDRPALLAEPWRRRALLVAGGVLGALAFPATDWWLFAWIWLVPALSSALARTPRGALADGWLSGSVFHVVLLRSLAPPVLPHPSPPPP